jgi:hypothetical protein
MKGRAGEGVKRREDIRAAMLLPTPSCATRIRHCRRHIDPAECNAGSQIKTKQKLREYQAHYR